MPDPDSRCRVSLFVLVFASKKARTEWTAYQQSFRPNPADLPTIQAEWTAKSRAEKTRWTKAFNLILKQLTLLENARRDADVQLDNLNTDYQNNAIVISELVHWTQFQERVAGVQTLYDDLKPEYEKVGQQWQSLHALENAQPNPNARSLRNALQNSATAKLRVKDCGQERAQLVMLLETPPVVRDPQGVPRMPDAWLEHGHRRLQMRFAEAVQGIRESQLPGLPGNDTQIWRAVPGFGGAGSYGTLWLRFDEEVEEVIDRVVRKDCLMYEDTWFDPTRWEGDVRSLHNKMPLELVITQAMHVVPGLENSIGVREAPSRSHVNDMACTYRLYLEFASKGDLFGLINRHKGKQPIPEPMIWAVAEALALAGKAMFQGAVPDENGHEVLPDDWMEVVHRDLKPTNVFLDSVSEDPDVSIYPEYDRPILGDYGLSIKTSTTDIYNPRWYNNRIGTPGFFAPEQDRTLNAQTKQILDEWELGEKTNVYGVGLILWCMVMCRTDPPVPAWLGDPALDTSFAFPAAQVAFYDVLLRTLILDCLAYNPTQRPSFDQMLARTQAAADKAAGAPNRAENMRSGNASVAQKAGNKPIWSQERYRLGMEAGQLGFEF